MFTNGSPATAGLSPIEVAGFQELIGSLPQEAAASVNLAKEIGGSLFVACDIASPASNKLLGKLQPTEYEAILLAAEGLMYADIAQVLIPEVTIPAVRMRLHKGYAKLSVNDKLQAGYCVPINERRLRSIPPYRQRENREVSSRYPLLTATLAETFDLLTDGLSPKEVAEQRVLSPRGVELHMISIGDRLGLATGPQGQKGVQVGRMAVAMNNLDRYVTVIAGVAATAHPQVTACLNWADKQAKQGVIDLDSQVVHTIRNQYTLASLEKNGYVPPGTTEHGHLDLAGLVASLLFNREGNRTGMEHELSRSTVREIIQQEVRYFMDERRERYPAASCCCQWSWTARAFLAARPV